LIALKFNSNGALAPAFEKPPAVERGVLPTRGRPFRGLRFSAMLRE
jgi:hypothetical protein